MSKTFRPNLLVFAALVQILQFFTIADAQDITARITVSDKRAAARVEGRFSGRGRPNPRNLVFLREYGGTIGLADRVTVGDLTDGRGRSVAFKKLIPGEYLADADFDGWTADISLSPIGRPSARAHISWIDGDRGILRLDDLLPQTAGPGKVSARVTISVPPDWGVITSESETQKGVFEVSDVERSVFIIAKNGVARHVPNPSGPLNVTVFDSWQFADSDAVSMADTIADGYQKLFGGGPDKRAGITIMRFPDVVPIGNWEADTRGNSIIILSSDMPFKSQSVQRLHEQLRHEIFHLWIPNGVNLSGNYDWFYEGFALYQSLKSGVAANRLRFDDMLDSLAQAYNVDNIQADRSSLIEASMNRWGGANTRVYARGMLVAFLCDLALLQHSKGRSSVEGILREIYQKYHSSPGTVDGNDAVLSILRSHPELGPIVGRYVTGKEKIDWQTDLLNAGIETVSENSFVKLTVVKKPTGRQRDLLDKLGYNNWRKLSESSK